VLLNSLHDKTTANEVRVLVMIKLYLLLLIVFMLLRCRTFLIWVHEIPSLLW